MNFFQKITAVWLKVSLVQRALLIAVALTFIIAGVLLTSWARKPDMGVLYSNLAPEEAARITEKISEKDIEYKLANNGTTIYVPKQQISQLRLDMAKEGLPTDGQDGYSIFDDEKIGVSPFVQNVNLKRALQDELAKSIQMINGVVYARVHIVSTEQTLFTSEAGKTTASVVLQLKPGYKISALNIAAITHLVAGSVEGLEPGLVTVIDSQGNLLSAESGQTMAAGAGTVADYRERVEQNLAEKAEGMLAAVLGQGRAKVKVSAEIDMTSINTVTETPIKGIPRKEEIKSTSETKSKPASSTEGEPAKSADTKKDETIVTDYQHGKTVKQEVILPGEIKSLSVAAFVDLSGPDSNELKAGAETAVTMRLSDVEEIIKNALGLKKTDSLKVVDTRFHRPAVEALVAEDQSRWPRYIAIARQGSLGIMAVCALFVLRIFTGAKRKVGLAAAERLSAGAGSAGLLPAGSAGSEPLALRKQITDTLQNNPEQARQLFASWLQEKEE
jgi:flagellar M-ring protein FliF